MAGAKITGTASVFPNFCPAFQDLEQCCFAVLSQFLLTSCLAGRSGQLSSRSNYRILFKGAFVWVVKFTAVLDG